jgi:hypothetical protein
MYKKCPTCGFATVYKQRKRKVKNASNIKKTATSNGNRGTSPRAASQAQQEFAWAEQGTATRFRHHKGN